MGERRTTAKKVLLSVAALAAAAGLAGVGTYASFTDSASVDQQISTGTLSVDLGATGTAANRLDIAATAVAPGDTMQRAVDVTSGGSIDLGSVSLTTAPTVGNSSILDTDTTDGLQMAIDRCSVAWTEAGAAPAYTYTCGGVTSVVLASTPVVGTNVALANMLLASGSANSLRVTLSLPTTADNTFQNVSSTIRYTFTGTQRAGTDR
jgi:spore coat-associated protein N